MTSREYFNAVLNAHISEEMDATSAEFIARLDAKNAKRKSTESKDKREARERRESVAAFLDAHEGEVFTRDAIAESVGITPAQASAACKSLIAEGIVTKTEVKVDKARKVGYSIAE